LEGQYLLLPLPLIFDRQQELLALSVVWLRRRHGSVGQRLTSGIANDVVKSGPGNMHVLYAVLCMRTMLRSTKRTTQQTKWT
jgi:hypothetical protein